MEREKMEFDKSRVYTALNADELKAGDKVIGGNTLADLKYKVGIETLDTILDEGETYRFTTKEGEKWLMVLLVERKENCTNCKYSNPHKNLLYCEDDKIPIIIGGEKLSVCSKYKPKTKQKEMCLNCKHYNKVNDFRDCTLVDNPTGACPRYEAEHDCQSCKYKNCGFKDFNTKNECDRWEAEPKTEQKAYEYDVPIKGQINEDGVIVERQVGECRVKFKPYTEEAKKAYENVMTKAEKHYRPFRDTDELIKVWCKKELEKTGHEFYDYGLTMPLVWVRDPKRPKCTYLLNGLMGNEVYWGSYIFNMQELFDNFEFLDGSPCGVEE